MVGSAFHCFLNPNPLLHDIVVPPALCFGLDHVTCYGQCDDNRHDVTKG